MISEIFYIWLNENVTESSSSAADCYAFLHKCDIYTHNVKRKYVRRWIIVVGKFVLTFWVCKGLYLQENFPCKSYWSKNKLSLQQLLDNLDRDLQYAIIVEGKMDLESVSNYDEVKNAIWEKVMLSCLCEACLCNAEI